MSRIEITVNDTVNLVINRPSMSVAHKIIRSAVEGAGHDWEASAVFVADYPEPGRYLQKSAGYTQLGAGG